MSRSLQRRLVLAATAWLLAAALLGGLALAAAFRAAVTQAFDAALAEEAGSLAAALESGRDGSWWLRREPDDRRYQAIYSGHYWQVGEAGGPVLRSRSLWDAHLGEVAAAPPAAVTLADATGPRGEPLRLLVQPLQLPHREAALTLRLGRDRSVIDIETASFNRLLAIALGVLVAGLLLAIALQVRYGLQPLRRLAAAARAVREGRSDRLDGDWPTEVQPLVAELGRVLDHNRRLLQRVRSSTADLAHALRTPLSVIDSELAQPGPAPLRDIAVQTQRLQALIERHLARAHIAGSGRGQRTPVAPVVAALARALTRLHGERGIDYASAVGDDLVFAGDREDLEELLGNLLDNAGKWAARQVHISGQRDGERLLLAIADDGPGLADAQIVAAGTRGRRFDEQAPGSGLGLAIVDDIVASYDGRLLLARSESGGLLATVELPAAPA